MKAKFMAEFIATFFLVFFGTGSIIVAETFPNSIEHLGISLSFGVIVCLMIYAFGTISGAHMNPAVSLSFFAMKELCLNELFIYLTSQTIGAISASFTLKVMFPENFLLGATLPKFGIMTAFIIEFLFSFFLFLVILRIRKSEIKNLGGMLIGGVIFLEALVGGPISGASMNPVRSIAPAIASQHMEHLWIYLIAPTTGMLSLVLFNRFLFTKKD